MHLGGYLGVLLDSEQQLAASFLLVAGRHPLEPEVVATCPILAAWSREHARQLQPFLERYGTQRVAAPALQSVLFQGSPLGIGGLLRDIQDLSLLASEVRHTWVLLSLAAKALHDAELQQTCQSLSEQTLRQMDWLRVHMQDLASQALIAS